jgi:hypothetical protein
MNNPNLAQDGAATRFGQPDGPDPRGGGNRPAPWSIRHNLRRLMNYPLEGSALPSTDDLLRWLSGPNGQQATLAMLMAVRRYQQAMQIWQAMNALTDDVDGKQADKQITSTVPFSEIVRQSLHDDLND